jgi:hypothetical protein
MDSLPTELLYKVLSYLLPEYVELFRMTCSRYTTEICMDEWDEPDYEKYYVDLLKSMPKDSPRIPVPSTHYEVMEAIRAGHCDIIEEGDLYFYGGSQVVAAKVGNIDVLRRSIFEVEDEPYFLKGSLGTKSQKRIWDMCRI